MTTHMETEHVDPLLTPEEMSKLIPLHPNTIIYHMKNGDLESVHIGRKWFARKSKFNAWVEAHTKKVEADETIAPRAARSQKEDS